jgi:hypothetical protein
MNKLHYLPCAGLMVFMLAQLGCTSVGPLTYRLAHNPPPVLVELRHEHGMRVEVWNIRDKPYKKKYFQGGKKVKEEIFTEDGRLYAEDTILPNGMEISKMFDERGRLKTISKNTPGNPEWHFFQVYNPDGSVKIQGKWRPLISPDQAKKAGIAEQIERGFDHIPPGGILPIPSPNQH